MTAWLTHLKSVTSTNDLMKEKVERGDASHGDVILADAQTAGRGRRGRAWQTLEGENGIAMTMLLKENLSDQAPLLISLAVLKAIQAQFPVEKAEDLTIKWPNDVMLMGQKICGILVESSTGEKPYHIVGCGMNILGQPTDDAPYQTLESLSGVKVNKQQLVHDIREHIMFFTMQGWLKNREAYLKHCHVLGKNVIWRQMNLPDCVGIAQTLTEEGALILKTEDGKTHTIHSGEIITQGSETR